MFRKRTFTGDYTSWESFAPTQQKLNLVSCLVNRAVKICSPSKLQQELKEVARIFENLGYPHDLVRRTIKGRSQQALEQKVRTEQQQHVYLRLPYIGPVSERFRKQLSHAINACYDDVRLRLIYRTTTLLGGVNKDRTPILDKSNVIYKFECSCDSMYIGRTTQRLHNRIRQHVPKFLSRTFNNPPISKTTTYKTKLSAIGQHLKDNPACGAKYSDQMFSVVARARSQFHLNVLEAIFIQRFKPILCKQKEFVYSMILFKY